MNRKRTQIICDLAPGQIPKKIESVAQGSRDSHLNYFFLFLSSPPVVMCRNMKTVRS